MNIGFVGVIVAALVVLGCAGCFAGCWIVRETMRAPRASDAARLESGPYELTVGRLLFGVLVFGAMVACLTAFQKAGMR